jgi:hypothetical protein
LIKSGSLVPEFVAMSLTEVLPEVQSLSRNDKIRLVEWLVRELEQNEQSGGANRGGFAAVASFVDGVGSVLEFFPPPERFDAWRMAQDVPLEEWPQAVRGLLAELQADAGRREEPS